MTEVERCAKSTFAVGAGDFTRSGDGAFFAAALVGADFFEAAFFGAAFSFAGFFTAAVLLAVADFFDAGIAAFFGAGLVAFFAAGFLVDALFAGDVFTADFIADDWLAAAAGFFAVGDAFFAADFATGAGFLFFLASAASFDEAGFDANALLAVVGFAFAVLLAALFVAGLAVAAVGFGDEGFMVNSYGRWTGVRTPCARIQRERTA